jgi:predicted acylesterase/phospholipase RssA
MYQPEVLVLGPGGMKGIIEVGALQRLYENGNLRNLKAIVGCSIGSVIGLLFSCGYTPFEIYGFSKKYKTIFEFLPEKLTLRQVYENRGIIDPEIIKTALDKYVTNKFGRVPTLRELKEITGIKLCTVSTNVDAENFEYIDCDKFPNLECTDAVKIGINMPGLIGMVKFNGSVYVDGALTNPYPVDVYDDGEKEILGLFISEIYDKTSIIQLSFLLYLNLTLSALRGVKIRSSSEKCKHLQLKTTVKDPTGILENDDDRDKLYRMGFEQASDFLKETGRK